MAPASSSRLGSLGSTLHFLGEAHEGTLRRLTRRIGSWFVQHHSHLFVAVAQLDARDNRFSLLWLQTLECPFVGVDPLASDGCFEWRICRFDVDAVEIR